MLFEVIFGVVTLAGLALYYITLKNKREKIDFQGKHVVITGGSSGIGFDLCIEAFKQGAHVSVIARNKDRLNEIKVQLEQIKKENANYSAQIIQIESLDISNNYEDVKSTFERLVATAGPVSILINNAGIFKCVEFSESNPQDAVDMMNVNYIGSVYCTRAVVGSMKNRKFGRIVFVSSQAGQIGIFGYTAYSASKFALRGFAEALQMELKPYNVYVTLTYPPDTDTPGLKVENLNKPEETKLMADTSGIISSELVAKSIITNIKKGSFTNYFGLNGWLLAVLTCGAGPATTFKEALTQLFTLPLTRLVAMFIVFSFDGIVKSCYKKKTKQN